MNRQIPLVVVCFFSILGAASLSSATIIGDDYLLDGNNFPGNFANVNLTFDGIAQPAPGLSVNEQVLGTGPNGEDILQFQFNFQTLPNDTSAGFAFQIRGLDWNGAPGELVLSQIRICIDCVSPLVAPATMFVTTSTDALGLNILFQTLPGNAWDDLFDFSSGPPSSMLVEFRAAVDVVPEPSTVSLLAYGLLMAVGGALRRKRA